VDRVDGYATYDWPMVTILAHITVRAGGEERFEAVARDLYSRTHEDESGVRRYEYWRGAEPRTYYTLLSFDDHRTFIAHQTSPHHEDSSPVLGELIEGMRLEWIDPIAGASELPATDGQLAPPGADELTRRYSERFAADVAEWWRELR
jgi:quinol monooxygenase YgiN